MKRVNRRLFISQTAMGLGAATLFSRLAAQLNIELDSGFGSHPLGFQTYPIRDILVKDFPGTLKMMASLGYQFVEMCSPPGYLDSGFGPLVNMKAEEMKRIIGDSGLNCPSCHYTFDELKDKLDDRIEFAHQLGLKHMICSSFWLPKTAVLKDYLTASDELNKIAEKISKAGMQMGYHNHEMEFAKLDNTLIYDAIMGELDPKLVRMQFQTEVINLGYKASTYFTKYPGRFISSHLSDWTADRKQVPIGQGIIDWKEYFKAAPTGGVQYFFVEMNLATFKDSANFINSI
jgi:sugar phosphate isomerase/epimerase